MSDPTSTSNARTFAANRPRAGVAGMAPGGTVGAIVTIAGMVLNELLGNSLLAFASAAGLGLIGVGLWWAGGQRQWSTVMGLVVGLTILMPFVLPSFISVNNAAIICALAIIAVSQYYITGLSGQMSLGQGAFAGIGGYGFAASSHAGIPWPAGLLVGVLAALAVGILVGFIALRLKDLFMTMLTLALVVALPSIAKLELFSPLTGGAQGLLLDAPWTPWGELLGRASSLYLLSLLLLAMVVIFVGRIARSRHGLAIRALEFSEVSARSSGVPLFGYRMSSFTLSAGIAGLGGGVYCAVVGIVTPDSFHLAFSLSFLIMIVLGGMRRIGGAIVGAALFWWLNISLQSISVPIGSASFDLLPGAVFGLAVIVVVLFLHDGLSGGAARLVDWIRRGAVAFQSSR